MEHRKGSTLKREGKFDTILPLGEPNNRAAIFAAKSRSILKFDKPMETVLIGKSDISVSRIAIGTWQASGWASSNEQKMIQVIRSALDYGVNFIDSAESYGDGYAEELVRKALEKNRHRYVIATKFSHRNAKPENARKALEGSLRRLNTDYIDLYQYHWPSADVPFQETISTLIQLKKEGKIRAIGLSNWMEPEFEQHTDLEQIDSLQNCYSLLWRSIEKKILPLCIQKQISLLAYSPLAQGILSGRFNDPTQIPPDPRRQNVLLKQENFELVQKVLEELRLIAEKYNRSMTQIALAWLLRKKGVSALIVGSSSLDQFTDNLASFEITLEAGDISRLDEFSWNLSENRGPHDTLWNWHSCAKKRNPLKP